MTASSSPKYVPLPKRAVTGLTALIELGDARLRRLAEWQVEKALDLDFEELINELSTVLGCETETLQHALTDALIPLNGMRRSMNLPAREFIEALSRTVSDKAPEEWRSSLRDFAAITGQLSPFFAPDSFFAQASKAFELLAERPAILQQAKIITELRPIYSEDTARITALLQTSTLVLKYWESGAEKSVHITLDKSDLHSLLNELNNAGQASQTSFAEATRAGIPLIHYGVDQE